MPVNHVIVFGDSLSDIGRKWKSALGGYAAWKSDGELRLLNTSATGRFSDSKNWTDYMLEDTAKLKLVTADVKASKLASGEYHRLSSRWIDVPGGSRFRYANYAVGGAVGWEEKSVDKWFGLTRFSDQVDEFWEDFRKLPDFNDAFSKGPGHEDLGKFLFIVMFGANDIYTDTKQDNVSTQIGNAIIKQCEKVFNIVKQVHPDPKFVVAGVGLPEQSVFYTSQLESYKSAEKKYRDTESPNVRACDYSMYRQAKIWRKGYEAHIECLKHQVITLNKTLSDACTKKNWHFFPMRESLLALIDEKDELQLEPNAYQTREQFEKIHYKKGNQHYPDPTDTDLRIGPGGRTALFTADQKHPTSRGYEFLWKKMKELLQRNELTFGILAGPSARVVVPRGRIWQKDSEVHTCQSCHTKFGVFTRKHHCRKCGGIFCDDCTEGRAVLDNPLEEKGPSPKRGVKDCRVCNDCLLEPFRHLQTPRP